jgi:DNA-binding NarL/FixJ family response regulator
MTTVLICDDRVNVRDSLTEALARVSCVDRIEHTEYDELLGRYTRQRFDLVLVGIQRARMVGVDTIQGLLRVHRHMNVIAFGAPEDVESITSAIAAGACGFLRWDPSNSTALSTLTQSVVGTAARAAEVRTGHEGALYLTEREMQVLRGMSQGLTNSAIGRDLFLSEDTIKTHARRLFSKLGVCDRAQAVAHGFRHTLIS